MAEETKPTRTGRERLTERFGRTHPDRKFEGDTAGEDLDLLAADELDRQENEINEFNTRTQQISDLFDRDERSAAMFKNWAAGGDPITYLVENFGDEFLDALNSKEGKKKFADAHEKYLDKLAKQKEADEQYEKNIAKSIGTELQEFAQENNLSDEEAADLFLKVHQIMLDAEQGIYTKETFRMAYNALHYDQDVALAREDGEVEGRNAKIRRQLRETDIRNQALPSVGGSAGGTVSEQKGSKKKGGLEMFGIKE